MNKTRNSEKRDTSQQDYGKSVNKSDADCCCGGPAPTGSDACCVKDADAKSLGKEEENALPLKIFFCHSLFKPLLPLENSVD